MNPKGRIGAAKDAAPKEDNFIIIAVEKTPEGSQRKMIGRTVNGICVSVSEQIFTGIMIAEFKAHRNLEQIAAEAAKVSLMCGKVFADAINQSPASNVPKA